MGQDIQMRSLTTDTPGLQHYTVRRLLMHTGLPIRLLMQRRFDDSITADHAANIGQAIPTARARRLRAIAAPMRGSSAAASNPLVHATRRSTCGAVAPGARASRIGHRRPHRGRAPASPHHGGWGNAQRRHDAGVLDAGGRHPLPETRHPLWDDPLLVHNAGHQSLSCRAERDIFNNDH